MCPFGAVLNTQKAFGRTLWTGLVGSVIMLAGLGVDASMHTNDHTLVQRESIWSLGNPGHLLLAIGIVLVVIGITSATALHVRAGRVARCSARPADRSRDPIVSATSA